MANWSINGKTSEHDIAMQRQAAGTVGDSHFQPASLTGKSAANVITPVDPAVKYYGGTWSVGFLQNVNNFLGMRARTNTPGSYLEVQFFGSSIAVVANNATTNGRFDVYIDGALANGAVNTYTVLSANYYVQSGLTATDTDIAVSSTSGFLSSGTIVIDGEEITYDSIATTFTGFTGCKRGVNGTAAAIHQAGANVYQANSNAELYAAYNQSRVIAWKKQNLSQGPHTLRLVVRSDKHASSSDYYVDIGGFILGGAIGAQNILTNVRHISGITGTTDGSGVLTGVSLAPADTNQQLLAVIGAYPVSGANWAFPMYNPTDGTYSFATNAVSASVNLVATVLYLGQTF